MLEIIKRNKLFVYILLGALILRVLGFWHGFPFIFHPDEPSVIRSALGVRFNPNPEHFDWPHLHFYLNYFLYMAFVKFRGLLSILPMLEGVKASVLFRDPIIFYMLGRILNGIMGALTLIPLYLSARELGGKKTALIAVSLFAVLPLHVRTSHFALIDVPMVFWMSWGTYFSFKVLKAPSYKNYALAGLFFGLAFSTKYNGLVGTLALVITHVMVLWQNKSIRNFVTKPFVSLFFCLIGFLIGTPYALFDYETFSRTDGPKGAFWQFTNVGSVSFFERVSQLFTDSIPRLSEGTGHTTMIAFCVITLLFIVGVFKKQIHAQLLPVLIPALVIVFYVAGFSRQQSHYYMPAYPFIVLSIALYICQIQSVKYTKLILITLLSLPLIFSIHQAIILSRTDTRVLAFNEVSRIVKKDETILYNTNDFDPLIEKFKKEYATKEIATFKESQKFTNGVWIVKTPLTQEIPYKIAKIIPNTFRNGPEIYIYYLQ